MDIDTVSLFWFNNTSIRWLLDGTTNATSSIALAVVELSFDSIRTDPGRINLLKFDKLMFSIVEVSSAALTLTFKSLMSLKYFNVSVQVIKVLNSYLS